MILAINGKDYKLRISHILYSFILLAFSVYILKDLRYNTAFVDEAIYATVGEEVLRGIFWESALSWMGGSYFYPLISALINRTYGLAGIRAFSFLSLLLAGICVGEISRKLGGRNARPIATGLFFSSASVLNLASLGTYDIPSVLFISLSSTTAYFSNFREGRSKKALIIFSSLLFLMAVLSKYIAIIFFPFIALLILKDKKRNPLILLLGWVSSFVIGFTVYIWFTYDSLINFFTSDSFVDTKERLFILVELFSLLNIFWFSVVAIFALLLIDWRKNKKISRNSYVVIILLLAGFMPITYHLVFANFRSIWKHMVFTQFFWTPILAVLLTKTFSQLRKFIRQKEIYANASLLIYSMLLAIGIFGVWINASLHWRFQRSWPSASAPLEYLSQVRNPEDKIFAEGSAVYKYHLFDGFEDPLSWTSTWYIEYKGTTGIEAMRLAIAEQAFDYIILNGYYTKDVSDELTDLANIYYEKVLTDSFKVSGEYDTLTFVWARKGN